MEVRDFFTQEEIRAMKDRIVRETCLSNFLATQKIVDQDGTEQTYHKIGPDLEAVIRDETVKQVKEYVREVVNTVAKEHVAASVDKFAAGLCAQLDKIAEKTNWYWSIK